MSSIGERFKSVPLKEPAITEFFQTFDHPLEERGGLSWPIGKGNGKFGEAINITSAEVTAHHEKLIIPKLRELAVKGELSGEEAESALQIPFTITNENPLFLKLVQAADFGFIEVGDIKIQGPKMAQECWESFNDMVVRRIEQLVIKQENNQAQEFSELFLKCITTQHLEFCFALDSMATEAVEGTSVAVQAGYELAPHSFEMTPERNLAWKILGKVTPAKPEGPVEYALANINLLFMLAKEHDVDGALKEAIEISCEETVGHGISRIDMMQDLMAGGTDILVDYEKFLLRLDLNFFKALDTVTREEIRSERMDALRIVSEAQNLPIPNFFTGRGK